MTPVTEDALKELTPTGTLRVGINHQNFLLVNRQKDANGEPAGIVPDLARELAARLGSTLEFIHYDAAGKLADGVKDAACDVGFLASEAERASQIDFSAAYLEIEANYLVPAGSPIQNISEVDRDGVRIAVSARSAYDLYLKRSLKHATLVRAEGIDSSFQLFVDQKLEVLAGLKARLVSDVKLLPGARILDGRFTAVQQSIGTPKGRAHAAGYLRGFAEDMKSSGFVARAIERHAVPGVSVAPPAG